jgi:hypothetical protein
MLISYQNQCIQWVSYAGVFYPPQKMKRIATFIQKSVFKGAEGLKLFLPLQI